MKQMVISSAPDRQPRQGDDIVDRLATLAAEQPDRTLYIELGSDLEESARLTAGQLAAQAARLAGLLGVRGLRQGDVVLLIATRPVEFLVGLFGCLWAGVIPAPISFPRRPEHLQSRLEPVRQNAGAAAVVAATPQGQAELAVLEQLTQGSLHVIHIPDAGEADPVPPVANRDIAYLQYTSGSTSEPRGVTITHANLAANLDEAKDLMVMTPDSVNVSWCPLTHDMGLVVGALPSVWLGMLSVIMQPATFIRRPVAWMRALDRYRGTHGCSPNFGFDLMVDRSTPEERAEFDLSSAVCFVNGAEPVRRRTRDRFLDAFAVSGFPAGAYAPGYGLAEATVVVAVTSIDEVGRVLYVDAAALEQHEVVVREKSDTDVRELCTDGVIHPDYDARIVDPDTCVESATGRVGELWLRGPSVSPGYWRREAATKEAFGGYLADGTGPYLRTGDLAFMHDGDLVICGRAKDLIVIRGRNIYPQDIEQSAELAHTALRLGGSAAFAFEDEAGTELESLVLVSEVDGDPDEHEVASAVKSVILREYDLHLHDVLLVPPYAVPKTSSGKKQRSATKRLWHSARGQA